MMESLTKGPALGLASLASFVAFSFGLSLPPDSIPLRLAVVCVLFALQYGFVVTFPASQQQSEYVDVPYGLMTLTFTLFWHAVDYLVVVRASSAEFINPGGDDANATTFARRHVWTPLALLCNWRRLGTSWQISKVPPFSRREPSAVPSRVVLILRRLLYIAASLAVLDLLSVSSVGNEEMMGQRALFSRLDQITTGELLFRAGVVFRFVASAIIGVYVGYAGITVVALVLCLSSPAECPPMFGQLSKTCSVRGYWGDFYHQGLRRAICGPADAFVDHVLGLARGTLLSRYLRLTLAFAISGAIHGCAEMAAGVPPSECGHFLFFTSQAFAVMFEDAVKHVYKKAGRPLLQGQPLLERVVGYCLVAFWLFWMAPYWAYSSAKYAQPQPSQLRPVLEGFLPLGGSNTGH